LLLRIFAPISAAASAREAKGDLKGALADLSKVIELKPQDSRFYDFRGKARQKMGDLDGALADFSKAIVLNRNLAMRTSTAAVSTTRK
jgi:Flp pilus assembly protein TadD